jgi:hypothetical protein
MAIDMSIRFSTASDADFVSIRSLESGPCPKTQVCSHEIRKHSTHGWTLVGHLHYMQRGHTLGNDGTEAKQPKESSVESSITLDLVAQAEWVVLLLTTF